MICFSDMKQTMRRDLHAHASVPAYYIPLAGSAVDVTVRVQTKFGPHSPAGQPEGGADRVEAQPRIIFQFADIQYTPLVRNGLVSVDVGEAYRIATVQPRDGEWQTVLVTRMSEADALALPVPAR